MTDDPLAHRIDLRLDPARTALLIVDLQEEYRVDPRWLVPDYDGITARAAALLAAARRRGLAIFHAYIERRPDGSDAPPHEARAADGALAFGVAGTPSTAFSPEVLPRPGETLLQKSVASAFANPLLQAGLQAQGIEWLVVAGVWSDACVYATVKDAGSLGYRVLLVKDACGSGTLFMHQTAIVNLANRLYGGAVATAAQATSLIEGGTQRVWQCPRPVPFLYEAADIPRIYAAL